MIEWNATGPHSDVAVDGTGIVVTVVETDVAELVGLLVMPTAC